MNTQTLILVGGAGLVAYLLFFKGSAKAGPTGATPSGVTVRDDGFADYRKVGAGAGIIIGELLSEFA